MRKCEILDAREEVWAEDPSEGTGAQQEGEASWTALVPGNRAHFHLPVGASRGEHAVCCFALSSPFNSSSWVVVSTFILLREGKNLRHLPRGKNALLITSRPEFRPKSTWFQSTHSSYYTVVFPVDPLARYFWPQVPSVQRWFFSIK